MFAAIRMTSAVRLSSLRLSTTSAHRETAPASHPAVNAPKEAHGFTLVEQQYLAEYDSTALLYRHKKTGAQLMSVINKDENKTFGATFRTPVDDSKGTPHILEHSVLCGSDKYPIKEPFVELMKGSLNTFLNAFTYPDRTCYPVASANLRDFYNLVDVYLDSVLHPNCVSDPQIFAQEGWHYELEGEAEPLTLKGVVFNEMKGVYSSPDSVNARVTQAALHPDSTYAKDSGGDPEAIPTLTFDGFKDFYARYYHPSNARFWFYGDDEPEERLRLLAAALDGFEARQVDSVVRPQPLLAQPRVVTERYAAGAVEEGGEPKTFPAFSVGLKGVAAGDVEAVEALILETLEGLEREGFSATSIEASLNTIEFALRENNTGRFPRGLSLMLRSMATWIYDRDPFQPLKWEDDLAKFKARIAEGSDVFGPLIRKYLLDNPHRVSVRLVPDEKLGEEREAREREALAAKRAGMSKEEVEATIQATRELKERQETPDTPESLACVPLLHLSDIPKTITTTPTTVSIHASGATQLTHDLFTNNILYLDVALDLTRLGPELLPLVPLFCRCLTNMGTEEEDFITLTERIGRKTGGVSVSPFVTSVKGSPLPKGYLMVRGKATADKAGDLLQVFHDILLTARLDDAARFKQMVLETRSGMEAGIVGSGHSFAGSRLDAQRSAAGWVSEQMGGVEYLQYLRTLAKRVDSDWEGVRRDLETIRSTLLQRDGALVNITGDESVLRATEGPLADFLSALPSLPGQRADWNQTLDPASEALVVPTQVNYVCKAANLYEDAGYKLSGTSYVINKFLGTSWIWDRVRVSGGAYGGFCDFDSHNGMFTFSSYRDPNLLKTVDVYDGTIDFLKGVDLTPDELSKAIIGTIGDIDAYQLPDAKGRTAFMRHLLEVSEEERQQRRDEILGTQLSDFHDFAEVLASVRDKGRVVAVTSADKAAAAQEERPGFFNAIHKIL
ncbi:Presequence protease 2, chloroplastic/mitochondrial [Auxenochlorella protothecoides]|uniref:Presequence protease 2, chloroplastic/mitochondrial n=1 Tax=Auxenochlorella protothecoides TaxID=3075 RepID=A0A087SC67_AUXPR|nr:Presequence protease 2, chloroplastic/mitochondrial [Auxenochlorella protothecoides]KFM23321.1 Presequence protease 2, chloroplastic/mitochondrial [Auxenochlorella protothecoides]